MSQVIDRPPADAGPGADQPEAVTRVSRWTRTHTTWLLIAASLLPGIVAAASREWWAQLPPGVRLSAYILSGILIVAACSLLLLPADEPGDHGP
ncbi:MAG TPA: hypothetical protein VMY76_01935 [Gemmatimonadales bacterium]|nr:hypothetical protein [Gemmatimonadales bacterium]